MPLTRTADVIVVAGRLTPSDIGWIKSLVERSEGALNRLLLLTGPINDPAVLNLAQSDPHIVFLPQSDNPGDVEACNRGFAERAGDAALLPQAASVSPGWLAELCAAAASEERTAFSWPLSSENSNLAQAELDVERSTGMAADLDFARMHARPSSLHVDLVRPRRVRLPARPKPRCDRAVRWQPFDHARCDRRLGYACPGARLLRKTRQPCLRSRTASRTGRHRCSQPARMRSIRARGSPPPSFAPDRKLPPGPGRFAGPPRIRVPENRQAQGRLRHPPPAS